MRKLITLIVTSLLLFSCAHTQRGADLRKSRDSVYKVRVSLTLDITPLNEWRAKKEEERKKREEAARKPWWKIWGQPTAFINDTPIAMNRAMEQMDFQVIKTTADTAEIGWSGTGWVVAGAPGRSFVMTAGHVCESKVAYDIWVYDIDWEAGTFEEAKLTLPILKKEHVMISRDGVESANGNIIRDEDLDEEFNGNDLCVVGVASALGPAIPLADRDPEYGETCSVVGAPTGLWGGGVAVASEAIFSGRGSVFGVEPDGLAFNGLLAPGNSGSAVVCGGRAVGVISLGSTRFRSMTHAVPHEAMRKFLKAALHK